MRINRILTAFVILMLSMSMTSFAYVSANSRQELPRQNQGLRPGAKHSQQNIMPGVSACSYDFSRPTVLFHRNRYYNPQVGRFTSQDPIGFAGDSNLYNYVANNPVLNIDPSGLWLIKSVVGSIFAVAEQDRESFADLGMGITLANQPIKFDGHPDICNVYAGDRFIINNFISEPMKSFVGQNPGRGNCFGAAYQYPNPDGIRYIHPFTTTNGIGFNDILTSEYAPTSLSEGATIVWKAEREIFVLGTLVARQDQLLHAGIVIYVSRSSNKPSIFSKLGPSHAFEIGQVSDYPHLGSLYELWRH